MLSKITSGYFITGTDTDVGKTVAAAALTMATRGYYWKPVQAGTSDLAQVKIWSGLSEQHFLPSVYTLKAPLSPDQAAALEHIEIDLAALSLPDVHRDHPLFVEGAGGVYTPLNAHHCMLDLMCQLALPVIIVSRGTLGTINHTLLTIQTLRAWNIPIQGVIFSGELRAENQKAIEQRGQVQTLFHIPHIKSLSGATLQSWVTQHQHMIQEVL